MSRAGRWGITLLAGWLVQTDIESGRLTRLFPDHDINLNQASAAISALYMPNRRGSRRVSAFIEFCEGRLSTRQALRLTQRCVVLPSNSLALPPSLRYASSKAE
ncbi:hypothetical protein EAW52_19980 [Pseudomonas sp. LTJR-52]|uniref:LysR substrate-binding domain-containing protein n=1 Tax=Pseudomonas sp. LTJR-52 TaxID=2479392 RepID=UPI000EFB7155|nr:hypothetical protein EAW52_19980 [Pseudomonas sp. LTJR-52]